MRNIQEIVNACDFCLSKALGKRCQTEIREESGWSGWFYIFCTNCNGPIDKKVYPTKQEAEEAI